MNFISASFLGGLANRTAQVWHVTCPNDGIIVTLDGTAFRQGVPAFPQLESAILQGLSAAGFLVEMHGVPMLSLGGSWIALNTPPSARYNVSKLLHFVRCNDLSMDPNDWSPRSSHDEADLSYAINFVEGAAPILTFPESLAKILSGAHTRGEDVRKVEGMLHHPVYGDHEDWIYDFQGTLPPVCPDYPHLRALFSAFPLTPESHAALYVYLLGVFHASSLKSDRPILFVDSWRQGRGKSQVCRALSILIDDCDRAMSLQHASDGARDEVVAHFLSGRSGYVDNIDGKRGWNHPLIASMATGSPSARPKHYTNTVPLRGCVVMLNGIHGAASFHGDLIDRMSRVELLGHPQPGGLRVVPSTYSQENRLAIISEILHAHTAADGRYDVGTQSRFHAFDRAGIAAYCAVFGTRPDAAVRLLSGALVGARALSVECTEHAYCDHPKSFLSPHERVFRSTIWSAPNPGLAPRIPADNAGATGLGFTLGTDLSWTFDLDPKKLKNGSELLL